jgi:hypothetical protein
VSGGPRVVAAMDYWYVRARNTKTGEEIQRIAVPKVDVFGVPSAASASEDMKAYLVRTGVANGNGELDGWEIVEVQRVAGSRLAH